MENFSNYYMSIIKNIKDILSEFKSSNDFNSCQKIFDLYIFLKIQNYLNVGTVCEDYTELNDDKFFIIDGKIKLSKNMSDEEYLEMCNSAKFLYDLNNVITPLIKTISSVLELIDDCNKISEFLKFSIEKYYSLDSSITEEEKIEFDNMLKEKISEELSIEFLRQN